MQLCVALGCAASARAATEPDLVIEWTAPAACPDQAELVSRVERSLGDAAKAPLTVTVHVTQTVGTFRAQLRMRSSAGYGERVLENTRCEILADSVALVIALSASRSNARSDAQDDGPWVALSAHATAVTGPMPRVAFGGGGTLAVEGFAALRLELSGNYYAEQSDTFDAKEAGADFTLLRFGARVCRVWSLGAFDLAPCLGGQFYRIQGAGFGGMATRSDRAYVWGPALGLFGRLRLLPRFAIYVAADGVVAVSRQAFVFKDPGAVLHRPSAVAFQLFVAPEVQF